MKKLLLTTAILGAAALGASAQDAGVFRGAADPMEIRTSDLMGMRLYASEAAVEADEFEGVQEGWEDIGEVNDVVLGRDGAVQAVLVDIGGFLGIGERQVAVSMDALRFVSDSATGEDADDYFLVLNAGRADLEAAPEYVVGEVSAEDAAMETEEAVGDAAAATGAAAGAAAGAVAGAAATTADAAGEAAAEATEEIAGADTAAEATEAATEGEMEAEATADAAAGEVATDEVAATDDAMATDEPAAGDAAMAAADTAETAFDDSAMADDAATGEMATEDMAAAEDAMATEEMAGDEAMATEEMAAADPAMTDDMAAGEMVAEEEAAVTEGRTPITREGFLAAEVEALTADRLQGAAVYDANDERVGEVSELLISEDGMITDAVVDVGGFLGIGEKPVAMTMGDLDILQQEGGEELRVYVSGTREELEAMPTYEE